MTGPGHDFKSMAAKPTNVDIQVLGLLRRIIDGRCDADDGLAAAAQIMADAGMRSGPAPYGGAGLHDVRKELYVIYAKEAVWRTVSANNSKGAAACGYRIWAEGVGRKLSEPELGTDGAAVMDSCAAVGVTQEWIAQLRENARGRRAASVAGDPV